MNNRVITKITAGFLLCSMMAYTLPVLGYTKEESVFSKLDASGNKYQTTVSEHLKNDEKANILKDITDLMEVVNVSGNEEIQKDNNIISWQANGEDIYYQGKSQKELPIDCKITYYLDGKELSKDEIAGKSGNIKIVYEYINKEKRNVVIDGKQEIMYVPFVVGMGTVIDNETNKNIKITNGKVIDNGNKSMVFGMAFPGMQESLGISSSKVEVPSSIEITMDASNFSMNEIYIFATPKLIEEADLKVFDNLDKIYNMANELKSASNQLLEGTKTLGDGAKTLNEGANQLNNSYTELDDGIQSAYDGSKKLSDGNSQIDSGVGQLQSGANTLNSGVSQINDALESTDLSGLEALTSGILQLNDGVNGEQGLVNGINSYVSGSEQLANGVGALNTQINNMIALYTAQIQEEMEKGEEADQAKIAQNQIVIGTLQSLQNNEAYLQLQAGAKMLVTLDQTGLTAGGKLETGASKVGNGAKTLNAGVESIEELGTKMGILKENFAQVQSGTNALTAGISKIKSGTEEAALGSKTLSTGLSQLNSGSKVVKSALNQIASGTKQLSDGSIQLEEGMEKFDSDGIQRIYNLVNGDVRSLEKRVEKLKELAEEYNTFTALDENASGSVKFIMMIDSLKKEEGSKEKIALPSESKEKRK